MQNTEPAETYDDRAVLCRGPCVFGTAQFVLYRIEERSDALQISRKYLASPTWTPGAFATTD